MTPWIVTLLALAFALACACCWQSAEHDLAEQRQTHDEQLREARAAAAGYRAEVMRLMADRERVPAEWLADLHDLPTTHEREYPL
ncbi:hypothetical protein ACFOOK_28270 [Micromonospora krabiensis]|uniref:Cell division protein FtsL n=1 Tax=Micromonospora krabiensis TaxID=307121 RepID=A0A1C3N4M8_9ACTN|nr:hypothetical protein [Micromonospora krabiensis]SBV27534.1 hypothetical protein GA0070620_3058 [Micromonospora krabiensis]